MTMRYCLISMALERLFYDCDFEGVATLYKTLSEQEQDRLNEGWLRITDSIEPKLCAELDMLDIEHDITEMHMTDKPIHTKEAMS